MDAFDADVLIYAATRHDPLGGRVRTLFTAGPAEDESAGIGSLLLVPEVLSKPSRMGDTRQVDSLAELLSRLDLRPLDLPTAQLAAALGASHRLRAADAVHLATAVHGGADRFITNNRRDFPKSISDIDIAITYPDDLPAPEG